MTTSLTLSRAEEAQAAAVRAQVRSAILTQISIDEGVREDTERQPSLASSSLSITELERPAPSTSHIPYGIDPKTHKFFERAKSAGILGEILELWRAVGKPRFDAANELWQNLIKYFVKASARVQAEQREVNALSGMVYSAPSGKTGPWSESAIVARPTWSSSFFAPRTGA